MANDILAPTDATEELRTAAVRVARSTFARSVNDDSMFDASDPIGSYPPGCVIVVDPNLQAQRGDDIVVRVPGADEAVLRQFELDGTQQLLKPLNATYPVLPMPFGAVILGVVIKMSLHFSRLSPEAA